jgi:hypothetical protein
MVSNIYNDKATRIDFAIVNYAFYSATEWKTLFLRNKNNLSLGARGRMAGYVSMRFTIYR